MCVAQADLIGLFSDGHGGLACVWTLRHFGLVGDENDGSEETGRMIGGKVIVKVKVEAKNHPTRTGGGLIGQNGNLIHPDWFP